MLTHPELLTELYEALRHLDDPPYLEGLRIAEHLRAVTDAPDLSKGQMLRRALWLAIAALDPGIQSMPNALEARSYQVLYRYAISRQSMVAIGAELGMSSRHAYRELKQATEALAEIVMNTIGGEATWRDVAQPGQTAQGIDLRGELQRLSIGPKEEVSVAELVSRSVEDVRPLARARGIDIKLELDVGEVRVSERRIMLRQAFLNLLSHMISVHSGDTIHVHLDCSGETACLQFIYKPPDHPDSLDPESPYAVATTLLDSLHFRQSRSLLDDGRIELSIHVPAVKQRTVLIVDDNPGLIQLFKRYLQHQPYRVFGASGADEAGRRLEELQPDALILDIMMPDRDGWEFLQTLRKCATGARMRIIVCSIINDPHLSTALGADAFLHKPVDRSRLLQTLRDVLLPA